MLPFTAEILFSSFEQYNRSVWPLPLLACVLSLVAVVLALRPVRFGDRAIAMILAAAWLWTGIHFHIVYFARFDFAAPVYGAIFVVQGLLLAWAGARKPLSFRFRPDVFGWFGLLLALAASVALPVTDGLTGHGWQSVRLVGIAPGPTAIFTLGLLLLVDGRTRLHLAVIPLLWTMVAGAIAWILWIPHDLVLPGAAIAAFGLLALKKRRARGAFAA